VKADSRDVSHAADEPGEFMREASRRHRLPVSAGAWPRLAILADPEPQKLLGLLPREGAQLVYRESRQRNRPGLFALRCLCEAGFCLFGALYDLYDAAVEIDIAPTEREDLARCARRSSARAGRAAILIEPAERCGGRCARRSEPGGAACRSEPILCRDRVQRLAAGCVGRLRGKG
jgi:hypothetical protein